MRDVHDDVAQSEEGLGVERLRQEVGQVVVRGDEGHAQLVLLDALAPAEPWPDTWTLVSIDTRTPSTRPTLVSIDTSHTLQTGDSDR